MQEEDDEIDHDADTDPESGDEEDVWPSFCCPLVAFLAIMPLNMAYCFCDM